jgi:hypothetical protein
MQPAPRDALTPAQPGRSSGALANGSRTDRSNIARPGKLAFPFGNNSSGNTVADHVRSRPTHIQEVIDPKQQQKSRFGNVELRQRRSDDNE